VKVAADTLRIELKRQSSPNTAESWAAPYWRLTAGARAWTICCSFWKIDVSNRAPCTGQLLRILLKRRVVEIPVVLNMEW